MCIPFDLAKCQNKKEDDEEEETYEVEEMQDSYDGDLFWICPECGSPVWGSSLCTCMLDEDWKDAD